MKNFIFFIGIALCVSCQDVTTQDSSNLEQSQTKNNLQGNYPEFNWSAAIQLKQKLIKDLSEKKDSNDVLITHFLDKYQSLNEEFNSTLNKLSCYDTLNTLAYSEGNVSQKAKDFEHLVNNSGFLISSTEGQIYISENVDFIKKDILNIVDSCSKEYLNLYCNQIENFCCEDAGFIISEEELVNRVYTWGELIEKVKNLQYNASVEGFYYNNLSLLLVGVDNTPAFDRETEKFSESLIHQMESVINKHPNSKAATDFQEFIDLLVLEDYKYTDKVKNYISQKTNNN